MIRIILLFSIITTFRITIYGQERSVIKGIVMDSATFERLPYASIVIKNTTQGTAATVEGSFAINVGLFDTLVFSIVGYNRFELPVYNHEPLLIALSQLPQLLDNVTIREKTMAQYYESLFQNELVDITKSHKKAPFYLNRAKKDKKYAQRFLKENERSKVYTELIVTDSTLRRSFMVKHKLNLEQYYAILRDFNQKNYRFMYSLTAPELLSLLNSHFEKSVRTN